jgi:hypothetical protein
MIEDKGKSKKEDCLLAACTRFCETRFGRPKVAKLWTRSEARNRRNYDVTTFSLLPQRSYDRRSRFT